MCIRDSPSPYGLRAGSMIDCVIRRGLETILVLEMGKYRAKAAQRTDDPQAGSVAHLGVRLLSHDLGNQGGGRRARLFGPRDDPRGGPLQVGPVGCRHVLSRGDELPLRVASGV